MAGFALDRFVEAQQGIYPTALAELEAGRKQSHWIWFIFPQLAGLGRSHNASYYGIQGAGEARAYLAHPILGPRLRECTEAVLAHTRSAEQIFGPLDAMKFRSSMTLFEQAGSPEEPFGHCLEQFFGGERDPATLRLLEDDERQRSGPT
jgi:uncharacterized protein (DUF1810 family)